MATATKRWTYKDYLTLDDDKRYEIIEGELLEMPAPSTTHQRLVGRFFRAISEFVEKKDLGEVFVSPGKGGCSALPTWWWRSYLPQP